MYSNLGVCLQRKAQTYLIKIRDVFCTVYSLNMNFLRALAIAFEKETDIGYIL